MVFLCASKVMVGDKNKTKQKQVSIEIRGPLASTKEHQNVRTIVRQCLFVCCVVGGGGGGGADFL